MLDGWLIQVQARDAGSEPGQEDKTAILRCLPHALHQLLSWHGAWEEASTALWTKLAALLEACIAKVGTVGSSIAVYCPPGW